MNYITNDDKNIIKRVCEIRLKTGDKIYPKSMLPLLNGKYCAYDVLDFIKNELKIPNDKIFYNGNLKYLGQMPSGHIIIPHDDVNFGNKYYHQYVVCKSLNIEIDVVEKYVIHHIDGNKSNNDIENLFIFYDRASHLSFHQATKHDKDIDLNAFNDEYIENIISKDNANNIKQYLLLLDKKNNLSKLNIDKL